MAKTRRIEETIGLLDQLIDAYKELHKIWDGIGAQLERRSNEHR